MDSSLELLQSGIGIGYGILGYVVISLSLMVMAKKEGIDNAWFAWIPILDIYLMTQIAGIEWWYLLLMFIPCVNFFVAIYIWWQICEARGKPGVLSLLMLIPIANLLVPLFLAFTD
jgi:hypothetical protein